MIKILLLSVICSAAMAQSFSPKEISSWKQQAKRVTIIRDTWGIPHIYGKTDADAVFGMLYAQCENDFERVERNYINTSARQAEAAGEEFLYHDLRMRLFVDTTTAISLYIQSPDWMKKLCQAFADGVNYYLYTHADVKPRLLKRFKPWMPLLFSEGSIGGDIETVSLNGLQELYGKTRGDIEKEVSGDGMGPEPRGSNGFAIAPSRSASGKALLLINPHTTFYFRSEIQVSSEEGLNAYGAVTWGQFFVYQGFNSHCGWMHTSSAADVIDEYREAVVKKGDSLFYRYGTTIRYLHPEKIVIRYRKDNALLSKEFYIYRTTHGPVTALREGKFISVKLMNDPLNALTQSFHRTKSASLDDFKKVMSLRTNSSNNTVYADDKGNIAYWHGNFMPVRDPKFNWSMPVDGSDPATEWKGLHTADQMISVENPKSGYIQNCNSTPFTVSGESSPDKSKFPAYMAPDFENARGLHAVKVISPEHAFTLDKLIGAAYDSYLPAFEKLMPSLTGAFDALPSTEDTIKVNLGDAIEILRNWDLRFSESSVATTLAIHWASRLRQNSSLEIPAGLDQLGTLDFLHVNTTQSQKLVALAEALQSLEQDFGSWRQTWGSVNRFQRLTGKIDMTFSDDRPSLAVPFTSSYWGSLASFGARRYSGTKKMYGNVGNSFVAVVEFGDKVKAKTIVTGGESSDVRSPHFADQSELYCKGVFKDAFFYREDVEKNSEKNYHPGE